jgi:hypothetical protein
MVKRVFALGSKYGAQAPLDLGFEDKTLIGGPVLQNGIWSP